MAQLVKHSTLGFGLGHDIRVSEFEPHIGLCTDNVEPAWDSLFLSLSLLPPSLSQNKQINLKKSHEKRGQDWGVRGEDHWPGGRHRS